MSAKLSTGYRELNSSLLNITSVSTNNSPLLRRLQITKIKHLLSFKSKISPLTKECVNNHDSGTTEQISDEKENNIKEGLHIHTKEISSKSMPCSPFKNKVMRNSSCDRSNSVSNSPIKNHRHLSYPIIHTNIQRRVKSVLSLPQKTLNSPTSLKIKPFSKDKFDNNDSSSIHILNSFHKNNHETDDNSASFGSVCNNHNSSETENSISYHPIDEIRDVVLVRDSSKRFGIKLDRTSFGEQITYIVMILPGSIAQMSGLKVGDQIVRVDNFYVHQISMETLVDYIRAKKDSVRVFYKARSLLVRTKVVHLKKENNRFGLRLIRRVQGVFVDFVIPDSAADKADLKEGDQLLKINNVDVSHWSQEKATHLLKNSTQTLTLHVYDATFAANDCLNQKSIFCDCNISNVLSSSVNTEFEKSVSSKVHCEFTKSLPNSPNRSRYNELKNHC